MDGTVGIRSISTFSSGSRRDEIPSPVMDTDVVEIGLLRWGDSPRSIEEDEEHIHRLAEMDVNFPPILVHRSTLRVIDGRHRIKAALLCGKSKIKVRFFDGDEEDAFIRAVAENIAHGLPLTLTDRKAAALRILTSRPQLSDRAIASYTGLAAKTIARMRERSSEDFPQLNVRMGADRRLRPLDGSDGRIRAAEVITERPDTPLREVARLAGVSLGTAHDVRRRMQRGESPVPNRRDGADWRATTSGSVNQGAHGGQTGLAAEAVQVSPAMTLRKLAEDPALRYSDRGRELLRLLRARTVTANDFQHIIDAIPAHRVETIAEYARQCARSWEIIAHKLELGEGLPGAVDD